MAKSYYTKSGYKVSLYRVPLNRGGFDSHGSYYGRTDEHLYECDIGGDVFPHARANSRDEAAKKLGLKEAL